VTAFDTAKPVPTRKPTEIRPALRNMRSVRCICNAAPPIESERPALDQ
jgi:hypothetical protein